MNSRAVAVTSRLRVVVVGGPEAAVIDTVEKKK